MAQTKITIALVYAVDQLLDYYAVNDKPKPEEISIDSATFIALREYTNNESLTHYRGVLLKQVNKNSKT